MTFKISRKAKADLEGIWLYTFEKWSAEQADRYFNLIMNEIEYLAKFPDSGTDYGKVRKGYFRARAKSHFIFYKFETAKTRIEVIRVLHQRMDIDARLRD